MLILFVGERNGNRALLSEAIFNHYAPEGFEAISAGATLSGPPDARTIALLEQHDISCEGLFDKSWHDLRQAPDVLVTLCSRIDTERCPLVLRSVAHTHWGDEDAGPVDATMDELAEDLEEAYAVTEARIMAFLDYPHEELRRHAYKLAAALDEIGTRKPGALPS
jgi:arsenate reductase